MSPFVLKTFRSYIAIITPCSAIIFLFCVLERPLAFADSQDLSSPRATSDFIEFWAASRALINGSNPFSPTQLLELQRSVGFGESRPLLMWHPPWTLFFVLPFGVLNFVASQFLWLLVHVFFLLVSAQWLWQVYCGPRGNPYLPWIVALTFVPTWVVLIFGQISPLVLLGIAGFLYFEKKRNWLCAGVATCLISVKPHLIYLFWIGLFLWILHQRRWIVAAGAILAGAVAAAIPVIFDPAVYLHFLELYRNPGQPTPFELPNASIGSVLMLTLPRKNLPIQFLPPLLAVLWFFWHWARYRERWDWAEQIPILLLVSLSMSSYAWTYDYVILLPAVMRGFAMITRQAGSWYRSWTLLSYGLISGLYLVLKFVVLSDYYYFWVAPAFLLTYLSVRPSNEKRFDLANTSEAS
ncbi:MAG TPA: glycosyltransferase family 87 protein [Terriglobales bacterium]|jgi:hypothetical protein|nr:glycosyltransferase family 87 protein [Terriglobales bacterium]